MKKTTHDALHKVIYFPVLYNIISYYRVDMMYRPIHIYISANLHNPRMIGWKVLILPGLSACHTYIYIPLNVIYV